MRRSRQKQARGNGNKTKGNSEQTLILETLHIFIDISNIVLCVFLFLEFELPILTHCCLFIHVLYLFMYILFGW